MEYFYTHPSNISSGLLTIDGEEFLHLTHVMRKKAGDDITVVDGNGNAYRSTISEVSKRSAQCAIRQHIPRLHEPTVDVTLAVGILKNPSRFDVLVEKATELGVNRIVPLLSERTIPRHAKTDRWQKIAIAAMKQSGRCVLPRIDPLVSFNDFIGTQTVGTKLIAHEKTDVAIRTAGFASSIVILIGPEGGFTDEEVSAALHHSFSLMSLGARRLRTETAAIVAVSRYVS
ncbi:MAG: 16S rRNA (uracil(1498)-N(3))-methyltransferase [Bacteroidetes bacterium]|nr:16S rRNA (uracil(1498)-N(3))-methyltransferase [Bacteroidota bacterium]MCW5896639.1 16S rRNA (uracil(1498)-N(3))-methyltransferase [Bacteroidota bacterium]